MNPKIYVNTFTNNRKLLEDSDNNFIYIEAGS
jgi:hypothetical protein